MKTFALALVLFATLAASAHAQWTRVTTGLAANATVTSLTRHDGSLFALEPLTTTRFGIFRSTNDGASWSRVGTLNVQTAILPLDIDAKIHSVGNVLLITTTLNGVYRSTDNGASWTPSVSGLPDNASARTARALLSLSGRTLIGTNNGVYASTNAGQSWSLSNQGIPAETAVLSFAVGTGGSVIAGTNRGAYRSTDNGQTWTEINNGLRVTGPIPVNATVNVLLSTGSTLLAACNSILPELTGIFRSTDNGNSWSLIPNTAPGGDRSLSALAVSGSTIFLTLRGERLLFGLFIDGNTYRSTDNGSTWTLINTGMINPVGYGILVDGSRIFVAGYDGIYVTTNNGNTWTASNTGLEPKLIANDFLQSGSSYFIATDFYGVYRSTDNGTTWSAINAGLTTPTGRPRSVFALAAVGSTLIASADNGLYRSTNNGTNWTRITSGLPEISRNLKFAPVVTAGNTLIGYSSDRGIYRSTDEGQTWTQSNTGLPSGFTLRAFAVSGTRVFAAVSISTGENRDRSVWTSTDGGQTWSPTALNQSGFSAYALAASGNTVWVGGIGFPRGFLRSTDNGATWTPLNLTGSTLPTSTDNVNSLAISGSTLLAFGGGPPTAFVSTNNGDSWIRTMSGLPESNASTLLGNAGKVAFLGTTAYLAYRFDDFNGGGVWQRLANQLSVRQVAAERPADFALEQNYPNPFNPTTVIAYQLPVASEVSLKVYDMLGRQVATLVNQRQVAGRYQASFNAAGLSSGVYFYRLQASSFTKTMKMMLVK